MYLHTSILDQSCICIIHIKDIKEHVLIFQIFWKDVIAECSNNISVEVQFYKLMFWGFFKLKLCKKT